MVRKNLKKRKNVKKPTHKKEAFRKELPIQAKYEHFSPIDRIPELKKLPTAVKSDLMDIARELAEDFEIERQIENEEPLSQKLAPFNSKEMRNPEGYRSSSLKGDAPVKIGDSAQGALARCLPSEEQQKNYRLAELRVGSILHEAVGFPGWPFLSNLELQGDYKNIVTTIVNGTLGSFGKFVARNRSSSDLNNKIEELNEAIEEFDVHNFMRKLLRCDTVFGIGFGVIAMEGDDSQKSILAGETETELSFNEKKMGQGKLSHFAVIEPEWLSPDAYDSEVPASKYWYKPKRWWANQVCYDISRCIVLITREISDLWKPSYNFSGLSLLYMAKTDMDFFRRNRKDISDILATMRTMVFQTNMDQLLNPKERNDLKSRIRDVIASRNNMGIFGIGQNESVQNLHTPLSGMDRLQAQSLERVGCITQIPVPELTGNQPAGLNASSAAMFELSNKRRTDVRNIYLKPIILRMAKVLQFHLWGKEELKNKDIKWDWDPISEPTAKDRAEMDWRDAESLNRLSECGAYSPKDVRIALIKTGNRLAQGIEDSEEDDDLDYEDEEESSTLEDEFKSEEHPRDENGRFAKSQGIEQVHKYEDLQISHRELLNRLKNSKFGKPYVVGEVPNHLDRSILSPVIIHDGNKKEGLKHLSLKTDNRIEEYGAKSPLHYVFSIVNNRADEHDRLNLERNTRIIGEKRKDDRIPAAFTSLTPKGDYYKAFTAYNAKSNQVLKHEKTMKDAHQTSFAE